MMFGVFSMNLKNMILLLFSILLLAACGTSNDGAQEADLDNPDNVKALVDEYSAGNFTDDHSASISATELIITNEDDTEKAYELPEDEFFVSIAPFVNETHPCDIHSLTGCQGELVDADFDIVIENKAGDIVVDETMNSEKNGFVDLWLSRDETYNVTVNYDGKEVKSEISTFDQDGTCITTMQLF